MAHVQAFYINRANIVTSIPYFVKNDFSGLSQIWKKDIKSECQGGIQYAICSAQMFLEHEKIIRGPKGHDAHLFVCMTQSSWKEGHQI